MKRRRFLRSLGLVRLPAPVAFSLIDFLYTEHLDRWRHGRLMDATRGLALVPPSYALPADAKTIRYAPEVRGWLKEYEKKYGRRRSSTLTTEQVPIEWTCGEARVIDVQSLVGSTAPLKHDLE